MLSSAWFQPWIHEPEQAEVISKGRWCAAAGVATVSRHEISRWERGERIPSPFWLGWLSEVLGIPIDQLERATARSRDRRTAVVAGVHRAGGAPDAPLVTSWPWRVIRACRFVDERGQVSVRLLRPSATDLVDGAAMDG